MKTRLQLFAAAALFLASPVALAKQAMPTDTPAPIEHPMPAEPAMPKIMPSAVSDATPAAPAAKDHGGMTKPHEATAASAMSEKSCRTRKAVGHKCACRAEPSHAGKAEASPNGGKNICKVA